MPVLSFFPLPQQIYKPQNYFLLYIPLFGYFVEALVFAAAGYF